MNTHLYFFSSLKKAKHTAVFLKIDFPGGVDSPSQNPQQGRRTSNYASVSERTRLSFAPRKVLTSFLIREKRGGKEGRTAVYDARNLFEDTAWKRELLAGNEAGNVEWRPALEKGVPRSGTTQYHPAVSAGDDRNCSSISGRQGGWIGRLSGLSAPRPTRRRPRRAAARNPR